MSIETALYTQLSGYAGLTDLVSTRIYPLILPQDCSLPAVTYFRVSGPRIHAMGSDTGNAMPRFQISCWASTYSSVKAVATQVRAALSRLQDTVDSVVIEDIFIENEMDVYDPDVETYHTSLDFIVMHRE